MDGRATASTSSVTTPRQVCTTRVGTPVSDVMSAPLVTIGSATDLDLAYRTFRRNGVRRLPVISGNTPVGMLTVDDLLRDAVKRLTDLLGPISWSALRDERRSP